ncbi:hypothetical protein JYU34_012729 [Plutella xylostella]|uniref:CS domain-containing protein n=1 Tax=Plutella xylostella TaxID=51655 RepID=A0ABQ7QC02_PLUXY|nr:hypothetical protein JYU34_012729 [Plutella xylostella]
MASSGEYLKYDEMLSSILVNEKSILGFLSAIFNFLARRTDFYYIAKGPHENMGFPAGVAEQLVLKVLRSCDPYNLAAKNIPPAALNNEIMCSTVAQEVEIEADENVVEIPDQDSSKTDKKSSEPGPATNIPEKQVELKPKKEEKKYHIPDDYKAPVIPKQQSSDSYNGAIRERYTWAQNIMELDVTVKLPGDIKSSKDLRVVINANDISVQKKNGEVIMRDSFPFKVKPMDSFWSISEGKLLIHLEKVQERWWNKFLIEEDPIDLDKIDASRSIDELPEEHVQKIQELQWNQQRKMQGLPTSDEMKNIEILKKAWNVEGSPFKGQEFDPSILHK